MCIPVQNRAAHLEELQSDHHAERLVQVEEQFMIDPITEEDNFELQLNPGIIYIELRFENILVALTRPQALADLINRLGALLVPDD